jgi:hypothetical protein
MPENLAEVSLPVDSFKTAAPHLRRPFTAEAVKWMVKAGTLVVPYIDARLVIERLNLVCPHLWHDEYEPISGSKDLLCRLTVDGITRLDVGSGYEGKGLYSDALKRAAVKFGVGVSLYALKKQWLETDTDHLKQAGKTKSGKPKYELTREGELHLRETYGGWLDDIESKFGPVLDHGDVEGAIGDVDADQEPPASEQTQLPAEPEKLTDAKAQALTEKAEQLFAALSNAQKKASGLHTKATFTRALAGAAHSHADLEALVEKLEKAGQ